MKRFFASILIAFPLVSCVQEALDAPEMQGAQTEHLVSDGAFDAGKCIVLFDEEIVAEIEAYAGDGVPQTKSAGLDLMFQQLGVTSVERLFPHAGEFEPRTRKEGLHRWYVLSYSDEVPYTKADVGLGALPGVELIQPVRKIKINDFNDLSSDLWGLRNRTNPGFDINVTPVWQNYTTGNPDVIVAVVDNGVDISHPDLAANCLPEGRHYNAVDGTSTIYPGDHGTHVAGTIAAVGNNGQGVVGVAGGDSAAGKAGVKILSCQIFKDSAEGTVSGNSPAAIKWGADHGAVISQNSWGYVYDDNGDGKITGEELDRALKATVTPADSAAIDYFIKYAGCDNAGNQLPDAPMKGGVVIFAAGNDNIANGAPAEYDKVIAVGSIASNGKKSSFSNYGKWVDIAAPGTDILSTVVGGGYASMDGTSMACPHVSGVAALVVSYHGGPGFTNDMLMGRLLNGANPDLVPSSYEVGRLVDAMGAMTYGSSAAPEKVEDLEASARANTMDLTWTAVADSEGVPAYGYMALYGKDKTAVAAATPSDYKFIGVSCAVCTPDVEVGEKVNFAVKGLDFNAAYHVKVLAYSYGLNYSEPSAVAIFETSSNNAPVIDVYNEGSYSIKASQTLEVVVNVADPDDHDFDVDFDCEVSHTFIPGVDAGSYIFTVVGKEVPAGAYDAVLTVTDEYGMIGTKTISFEVLDNAAPVVIKEIEDILLSAKGKEMSIDMTEYVTDPDGEQLKYEVTVSNNKVVHVTPRADRLYVTALAYGLVEVEIAACDVRGEKAVFKFKVLVKDPSDPVSVYPNPVTDYVNVGTLDMAETVITITSSTGKVMYEETSQVSGIEPARIDMTGFAPGSYSVKVSFGGNEYKRTVVKL